MVNSLLFLFTLAVILFEELLIIVLFIDSFHHAILDICGPRPLIAAHYLLLLCIHNLFFQTDRSQTLMTRCTEWTNLFAAKSRRSYTVLTSELTFRKFGFP